MKNILLLALLQVCSFADIGAVNKVVGSASSNSFQLNLVANNSAFLFQQYSNFSGGSTSKFTGYVTTISDVKPKITVSAQGVTIKEVHGNPGNGLSLSFAFVSGSDVGKGNYIADAVLFTVPINLFPVGKGNLEGNVTAPTPTVSPPPRGQDPLTPKSKSPSKTISQSSIPQPTGYKDLFNATKFSIDFKKLTIPADLFHVTPKGVTPLKLNLTADLSFNVTVFSKHLLINDTTTILNTTILTDVFYRKLTELANCTWSYSFSYVSPLTKKLETKQLQSYSTKDGSFSLCSLALKSIYSETFTLKY